MAAIFQSCEDLKVDKRVSSLAVPLAVTLNRDGTTVFLSAACLFLAHMNNVPLQAGQIVMIW